MPDMRGTPTANAVVGTQRVSRKIAKAMLSTELVYSPSKAWLQGLITAQEADYFAKRYVGRLVSGTRTGKGSTP